MSWAIGFDTTWNRDIGYGVPAWCDHPDCGVEIDRGLAYVCGGQPYGGEAGCGLYFCGKHRQSGEWQRCERCDLEKPPFEAKSDHPDWIKHKMTDPSWDEWRKAQPTATASGLSTTTE